MNVLLSPFLLFPSLSHSSWNYCSLESRLQAESASHRALRELGRALCLGTAGGFYQGFLQLCSYNSPLYFAAGTRLTVTGMGALFLTVGVPVLDHDGPGKEHRYKIERQSHLFPSGTLCPLQPSPAPGSLLIPGFAFSFYSQIAFALGLWVFSLSFLLFLGLRSPCMVTDALAACFLSSTTSPPFPVTLLLHR